MKESVGQRIRQFLNSKNISSRELQKHVSVGEKQISNWISGVSHLQVKHIIELASVFPDLDINWLVLGIGSPSSDKNSNTTLKDECNCEGCVRLKVRLEVLREECDRKDAIIAKLNQQIGVLLRQNRKIKDQNVEVS